MGYKIKHATTIEEKRVVVVEGKEIGYIKPTYTPTFCYRTGHGMRKYGYKFFTMEGTLTHTTVYMKGMKRFLAKYI